jgi:signal transduction histidine kinase
VRLELSLPDRVPYEVGRSVLRLVQESLTNVSKHAVDAGTVRVGVSSDRSELHVWVHDDGTARRGAPVGGSGGYGLVGMRERVELLGGLFSAGPATGGGWLVEVAIPLRSTS